MKLDVTKFTLCADDRHLHFGILHTRTAHRLGQISKMLSSELYNTNAGHHPKIAPGLEMYDNSKDLFKLYDEWIQRIEQQEKEAGHAKPCGAQQEQNIGRVIQRWDEKTARIESARSAADEERRAVLAAVRDPEDSGDVESEVEGDDNAGGGSSSGRAAPSGSTARPASQRAKSSSSSGPDKTLHSKSSSSTGLHKAPSTAAVLDDETPSLKGLQVDNATLRRELKKYKTECGTLKQQLAAHAADATTTGAQLQIAEAENAVLHNRLNVQAAGYAAEMRVLKQQHEAEAADVRMQLHTVEEAAAATTTLLQRLLEAEAKARESQNAVLHNRLAVQGAGYAAEVCILKQQHDTTQTMLTIAGRKDAAKTILLQRLKEQAATFAAYRTMDAASEAARVEVAARMRLFEEYLPRVQAFIGLFPCRPNGEFIDNRDAIVAHDFLKNLTRKDFCNFACPVRICITTEACMLGYDLHLEHVKAIGKLMKSKYMQSHHGLEPGTHAQYVGGAAIFVNSYMLQDQPLMHDVIRAYGLTHGIRTGFVA